MKQVAMCNRPAHEIVKKIVEGTSTCALGYILEQHCELLLATTLQVVFFGNHAMARELIYEPETVDTLKSIVRAVKGIQTWQYRVGGVV
jgi:hypothetical protein